jgi:large subunit GTPase 1
VFPNFATTKAELVVNGVLPIDQQREFTGPTALVAQRIPKHFLKAVYGMEIPTRPQEDGGTGVPTASEILRAYARARGFTTTGQGQPDESRAARYILKDYVNGKLLFCHPPPPLSLEEGPAIDPAEFNKKLYNLAHLPVKRRKVVRERAAVINNIGDGGDDVNSNDGDIPIPSATKIKHPADGPRTRRLDQQFFGAGPSDSRAHLTMPFNHKYSEQGRQDSTDRKQKMLIALEKGIDVSEMAAIGNSKKHFKGGRKQKTRTKTKTGADYDD